MTIETPLAAEGCGGAPDPVATVVLTSEALLGDRREIVILHRGSRYVLRVTRQGGLILNRWGEDDHGREPKR